MGTLNHDRQRQLLWTDADANCSNRAILEGIDCMPTNSTDQYYSTGRSSDHLQERPTHDVANDEHISILLADGKELLKVESAEEFITRLNCKKDEKVKVVSIFGNKGDGKSHTLNKTFFSGEEVFPTSNKQDSCTLGVWAAYDSALNVICLDTEGLSGIKSQEAELTRLLLKVLAISDIVVYRIQAEKLGGGPFEFLGMASRAYREFFQGALQSLGKREGLETSFGSFGPNVILFHETRRTEPLISTATESAEDVIRTRFAQRNYEIDAFSSIKYVGVLTKVGPTDYEPLREAIISELQNTTVRSARKPEVVYTTLKLLSDTFSSQIKTVLSDIVFPDEYFTCQLQCLSCGGRCRNTMGHLREGKPHTCATLCHYQHQYNNRISICKKCHNNGKRVVVTSRTVAENDNSWYGLAKCAWSGPVIECPYCGEIYRSWANWYGNKEPEDEAVRTEIEHVWSLPVSATLATQNTAQRMIDGVSYLTEAVASASLPPAKALTSWMADQVAPGYWRPNSEITHCHNCRKEFGPMESKHHCRACGEGFCSRCSSKTKCVPARNWYTPVRVCDLCYTKEYSYSNPDSGGLAEPVTVRKVTETLVSTLSVVGSVYAYSKSLIKDTARPEYWVPDSQLENCWVCKQQFTDDLPFHHCRDCGQGVCDDCSPGRKAVPYRGWADLQRVCNICIENYD